MLLQAKSAMDAIRLRANRLKVWKKGKLLAETEEVVARLNLAGRLHSVAFSKGSS